MSRGIAYRIGFLDSVEYGSGRQTNQLTTFGPCHFYLLILFSDTHECNGSLNSNWLGMRAEKIALPFTDFHEITHHVM